MKLKPMQVIIVDFHDRSSLNRPAVAEHCNPNRVKDPSFWTWTCGNLM